MKKILLSLVVPLVFMTTLSAQISQEQADEIIIERLSDETKPYCLYAQKEVQTEFEITTATGEVLELGYSAWVYYVSYTGEANGKYLVVKESNGNLLDVNAKNDADPDGLEEWRAAPFKAPFIEYDIYFDWDLYDLCWKNITFPYDDHENVIIINSNKELEKYLICMDDYPPIDFSEHTLLLASGVYPNGLTKIKNFFLKKCTNQYILDIAFGWTYAAVMTEWCVAILASKIDDEAIITLKFILP